MSRESPLSGGKEVIVDANIFIAIGDPSNTNSYSFALPYRPLASY